LAATTAALAAAITTTLTAALTATLTSRGIIAATTAITTLVAARGVIAPVTRIIPRPAIARSLRLTSDEHGPVDPQEDDVVTPQHDVPDGFLVFHGRGWDWHGLRLVCRGLRLDGIVVVIHYHFLLGLLEVLVPHVLQVHVQVLIESRECPDIALVPLDLDGHGAVQVQVKKV
jgi:hypothetical protein